MRAPAVARRSTAPRAGEALGPGPSAGVTLPELLIALTLLSVVVGASLTGLRRFREAGALHAAARTVRAELVLARRIAVSGRETVRVRVTPDGDVTLLDAGGRILSAAGLGGAGGPRLDSLRLRPATLRFNPRGQAAPGSAYLYLGRRGIRLVCNFLGRVRQEPFSIP